MSQKNAISPTRCEDFPEWFQQVIKAADLAEHSPVKGCMVIKPWGYAIWERIQGILDQENKKQGCQNAYFPLFIPLSAMQKEADHVAGFAKECAVVTHTRLAEDNDGQLVPAGQLEEPLIVRPTSEVIIGEMFAKWIQSYRDMPLKINQWANVVRMEMRTRMFLRTSEFLWHEAHTCHANAEEALTQAKQAHQMYEQVFHRHLALPTYSGEKSPKERFAGAESTFTSEGIMQDGKALQLGTAHFLGQHFSKSANILFQDEEGKQQHPYTCSWGTTTRLIGAMVMVHGDDDGLRLPPGVAPYQVVILPMQSKDQQEQINQYATFVQAKIRGILWQQEPIRVHIDHRPLRGGEKKWQWVKKGVPIRIIIGGKELEQQTISIECRHQSGHKDHWHCDNLDQIPELLGQIQDTYFRQARNHLDDHRVEITDISQIFDLLKKKSYPRKQMVFDVCLESDYEAWLAANTTATTRCILGPNVNDKCLISGEKANARVVVAESY